MALRADVLAFRNYLRSERGLSLNTLAAYGRDLERYAVWVDEMGTVDPYSPTLDELTRYVTFLHELRLAAPSVARHLAALRTFYRYLRLEEKTDTVTPGLLAAPKLWARIPYVLPPEGVDALLAAPRPQDRFYLRDKALLETLYATGCRASEVIQLKAEDVHLDEAFVKCLGKGDKERIVPLGRAAVAALRAYLGEARDVPLPVARKKQPTEYVFLTRSGKRVSRILVWELVKKYCKRAGLSPDASPHTLRHSFATHMLANGMDVRAVQELLGHASIRTTQHYTHVDASRLKAIHTKFHPRAE